MDDRAENERGDADGARRGSSGSDRRMGKDEARARLAAALRANLRRRKAAGRVEPPTDEERG